MGTDFFESLDELKLNIEREVPHIGIGEGSVIRRAILDKNVRIGKNVRLINKEQIENFDDPTGCYFIRDGIIIVPKNAMIKDGTEV